jgi:hypothetical protein
VTGGARLWPNLGGEEGRPSPALDSSAPLRDVARVWALLFGRGTRLLAAEPAGDEERQWPDGLGAAPETPCWDWLEDGGGGVAWWPDVASGAALASRGAPPRDAPACEVVRAVHDKAFTAEHAAPDDELGGLLTVLSSDELADAASIERALARWPEWARERWALKPRLGSTGRGRVHGRGARASEEVCAALPRLASRGGAVLEPWLDRVRDFSVQLVVRADGRAECLGSLHQLVKPGGAVLGGAGVLDEEGGSRGAEAHESLLRETALALASAAAERGFRGPCGVDSFSWRGPDGRPRLRAACELNARFTTGHVAIGIARRARAAGRLRPHDAWRFELFAAARLRPRPRASETRGASAVPTEPPRSTDARRGGSTSPAGPGAGGPASLPGASVVEGLGASLIELAGPAGPRLVVVG